MHAYRTKNTTHKHTYIHAYIHTYIHIQVVDVVSAMNKDAGLEITNWIFVWRGVLKHNKYIHAYIHTYIYIQSWMLCLQ